MCRAPTTSPCAEQDLLAKQLRIYGVRSEATQEDVRQFFSRRYGSVLQVQLQFRNNERGRSGSALVEFCDEASARAALSQTHAMRNGRGRDEPWLEATGIGHLKQQAPGYAPSHQFYVR